MRCAECNFNLEDGQKFCPNCGSPRREEIIQEDTSSVSKKRNKLNKKAISAILVVVTIGIIGVFISNMIMVKEILINRTEIELEPGQTANLKYEIVPNSAIDKTVIWESSDESVASVSDAGLISAKKEGVSKLTIRSKNGKSVECRIIVEEPSIDFESLYRKIGGLNYDNYATLASDKSYIEINTNPEKIKNFTSTLAISMIEELHKELGLPDSVYNKMLQTRALDGRLTETHGKIKISWSYSPTSGMNIIYEKIN